MGAIKFYTILPWGTIIMCATINFLQNLPQGTVIRAVLLLGSEEYTVLVNTVCLNFTKIHLLI